MIGVPGTVGGAIIMNAGAHGTEISEKLISIRTLNYNGKLRSAELLLREDNSIIEIRRAETTDDLFATLDMKKLKEF